MSKHTPAPFHFDGHGVNDANGERIAKLSECGTIPSHFGNSRNPEFYRVGGLLAAAPELLEALQECYDLLDNSDVRYFISNTMGNQTPLHKALNAARAIIAKAKG